MDPITDEPLKDPVVASDGYTYNLSTLETWLSKDALRRSPMTREVLRPHVYHLSGNPPSKVYHGFPKAKRMQLDLDTTHIYDPWLSNTLRELNLWKQTLSIVMPVLYEDGKAIVGGSTPPHPLEKGVMVWLKEFRIGNMFQNPMGISTCDVNVNGVFYATVEEIVGSEISKKYYSLLNDL